MTKKKSKRSTDLEKFCREDQAFFKVIIGDFNAKTGPRRSSKERHSGTHESEWNEQGEKAAKFKNRSPRTTTNRDVFNSFVVCWEDAVVDDIEEEYDRLIEHLHVSAIKAESSRVTKKRLSPKALELIRQRGIARAAGNHELTSELTMQAIKEDLKMRGAAVMVDAAEAGRSILEARRSSAQTEQKHGPERQWRKSSTNTTQIFSIATSTTVL
uniref:Endo/exonuclease/phosphatase domain-containing protein n=1 Tax=Angiostrongylus cantonensis TaxID=6313 RepID=A0A0K0D5N9_ANGCA